jgi:hypothetical protein
VSRPTSALELKSASRRKPGPILPPAQRLQSTHHWLRLASAPELGSAVGPGVRRDAIFPAPKTLAFLLAVFLALSQVSALAAETAQCARGDMVLWGDGTHDDTAALNAWLRGDNLVWATTGEPVGEAIADHVFRLSSAIYVPGGTGRRLDRFRLVWPERGETVTGGSVRSGDDPDGAPIVTGVEIVGGDSGEGVPLETPEITRIDRSNPIRCAVS